MILIIYGYQIGSGLTSGWPNVHEVIAFERAGHLRFIAVIDHFTFLNAEVGALHDGGGEIGGPLELGRYRAAILLEISQANHDPAVSYRCLIIRGEHGTTPRRL